MTSYLPRTDADGIRVSVAWSPGPRQVRQVRVELAAGSTVAQALARVGRAAGEAQAISVWSNRVGLDHVLQDGDRVELSRPLRVDPKVARRERFARQGARTAGLFARDRTGGEPPEH